jgi:phage shock protein A
MEKWSSSIGNLDEFTHALAEELAETLAKLTDEIVDAKKVIKNADNQRKQRQKQLDESINKIDKLMKQTLHVNVSQENGKTISGAWEKPD